MTEGGWKKRLTWAGIAVVMLFIIMAFFAFVTVVIGGFSVMD